MHRFVLPALLLLVSSALLQADEPPAPPTLRLNDIGVVRFLRLPSGAGQFEQGWLGAAGNYTMDTSAPTVLPPDFPESALGRRLIFTEAWYALGRLGPSARANFRLTPPGSPIVIGGLIYFEVEPAPHARLDTGELSNVSTRGYVDATHPLIGGFVIRERPRKVLVRAIGPTLSAFGVDQPLPNPHLTIFAGSLSHSENDDWHTSPDAQIIVEAAVKSGAFALPPNSADAAMVLELPPGSYTAHVSPSGGGSGEALVEVYALP